MDEYEKLEVELKAIYEVDTWAEFQYQQSGNLISNPDPKTNSSPSTLLEIITYLSTYCLGLHGEVSQPCLS
jgi:hypothetical protein